MSYQEDLDKREEELTRLQLENSSRLAWTQILRIYGIADHTANYHAVKDYCDPLPITVDGFRLMLDNPQAAATLDFANDSERIIGETIRLLRDHGSYTEHDLKTEGKKLRQQTKEQQRVRLAEVRMKQAHALKPLSQLKAELAEARRDTRRYPGYADLPMEIVPDGKVRAVHCDAKFLKSLDPCTLRKYVQRFGIQQVNDALRERV